MLKLFNCTIFDRMEIEQYVQASFPNIITYLRLWPELKNK